MKKTTATVDTVEDIQKTWEVPLGFSNQSFILATMFAIGDSSGTNISSRPRDFVDDFLHVACKKCCVPKHIILEEVGLGTDASFLSLIDNVTPFEVRTSIKLVGHLQLLQKCGKEGFLAVDGTTNHFICRSKKKGEPETLKVVSFIFSQGSWILQESEFTGESHVFEGPCRVYFSIR